MSQAKSAMSRFSQSLRGTTPHPWVKAGAMLAVALAAACMTSFAFAQAFPSKPIRLEVGAPAGGGTDIVARMLGEKLGESM